MGPIMVVPGGPGGPGGQFLGPGGPGGQFWVPGGPRGHGGPLIVETGDQGRPMMVPGILGTMPGPGPGVLGGSHPTAQSSTGSPGNPYNKISIFTLLQMRINITRFVTDVLYVDSAQSREQQLVSDDELRLLNNIGIRTHPIASAIGDAGEDDFFGPEMKNPPPSPNSKPQANNSNSGNVVSVSSEVPPEVPSSAPLPREEETDSNVGSDARLAYDVVVDDDDGGSKVNEDLLQRFKAKAKASASQIKLTPEAQKTCAPTAQSSNLLRLPLNALHMLGGKGSSSTQQHQGLDIGNGNGNVEKSRENPMKLLEEAVAQLEKQEQLRRREEERKRKEEEFMKLQLEMVEQQLQEEEEVRRAEEWKETRRKLLATRFGREDLTLKIKAVLDTAILPHNHIASMPGTIQNQRSPSPKPSPARVPQPTGNGV